MDPGETPERCYTYPLIMVQGTCFPPCVYCAYCHTVYILRMQDDRPFVHVGPTDQERLQIVTLMIGDFESDRVRLGYAGLQAKEVQSPAIAGSPPLSTCYLSQRYHHTARMQRS